jgi:hypothetical protein
MSGLFMFLFLSICKVHALCTSGQGVRHHQKAYPEDDLWAVMLRLGKGYLGQTEDRCAGTGHCNMLQTEVKVFDGERMVTMCTERPYARTADISCGLEAFSTPVGYQVYVGRSGADAVDRMVSENRFDSSVDVELCLRIDGGVWNPRIWRIEMSRFATTLVAPMKATFVRGPRLLHGRRGRPRIELTNSSGIQATLQTMPPVNDVNGVTTVARRPAGRPRGRRSRRTAVLLSVAQSLAMANARAHGSPVWAHAWPAETLKQQSWQAECTAVPYGRLFDVVPEQDGPLVVQFLLRSSYRPVTSTSAQIGRRKDLKRLHAPGPNESGLGKSRRDCVDGDGPGRCSAAALAAAPLVGALPPTDFATLECSSPAISTFVKNMQRRT